jgi:hypothetical protein
MTEKIQNETTPNNESSETIIVQQTPNIAELIIKAICEHYGPSGNDDALELKSTIDLMNEISAIADIEKWEITTALKEAGFKLKYTSGGMFWALYAV